MPRDANLKDKTAYITRDKENELSNYVAAERGHLQYLLLFEVLGHSS
jgi:hypothetical protein